MKISLINAFIYPKPQLTTIIPNPIKVSTQEIKTQSLKQQGAWLLAAKLIGFAFSFALPLLIVRYLTQSEVGLYREAFQVITNAAIILPLGFSMSAYYFLARETERRSGAVLNILLFNFATGGLACLTLYFFPHLLGSLLDSDDMARLAPTIGIIIWIWIFSSFLETVAIANQETRIATLFIIGSSLTKTLLMGSAVLAFATVEAFLYAAIIQGIIQICVLIIYLRSRFPGFWSGFDPAFFREQMKYAIPFGLTGILWMAQNDIHNYFVIHKFSAAEFAIYAYGCFEVPLIAMLSESVSSVLYTRMNQLHQSDDREEMIRLTARAMQKLALVYFPIYIFLFITSRTFIVTLFTEEYAASASIFAINLTLLPLGVLITDPIVRSFKELGRIFLLTRLFVLSCLVAVLYFGLGYFSMTGMITVAVGAFIIEKVIAESMVIKKLGLGLRHLSLLTNVGKTALTSLLAGLVTYLVYTNVHKYLMSQGENLVVGILQTTHPNTINFVGGSLVLFVSGCVFVPIYLIASNLWGVIEDSEKQAVKNILRRLWPGRGGEPVTDSRV